MTAKASELAKVARKLGFEQVWQKGSHARWKHPDGRATTIPIHGNATIGSWLFHEILKQRGLRQKNLSSFARRSLLFFEIKLDRFLDILQGFNFGFTCGDTAGQFWTPDGPVTCF